MKKILIIVLIVFGIGVLAAVGGAAGLYWWAAKDLPGFRKITDYNPPLVTTVYCRDGGILGYFCRERRFLVRLDAMAPDLPKAFLAAEDAGFYKHEGVDLQAIFRAFMVNLKTGSIKQGGSTITQQIIKRLLLSPEKSYKRKLKEAILAYRLERYLTKEEILTIYLNQIYLGAGAYGVEAAARIYFGKHVGELDLAECALLAGLPQAPSRYDPYKDPEAAKQRQKYVLDQMLDLNWITRDQYGQALAKPLAYTSMPDPSWKHGAYYLEEVRRLLVDRYGEDTVYEGGLKVFTACDMKHQDAAEEALRSNLEASTKRRGWRGPVAKLAAEQYTDFLIHNATSNLADLKPGDKLLALVTKVSPGGAVVRFGNHTARVPVATMRWTRTPDPSKAPEDVRPVRDATAVLEPGDVVWTSFANATGKKGEVLRLHGPNATDTPDKVAAVRLALEQEPLVEGAIVSLLPENGDVLALSGGYSFGRSQFNRATQAMRQPGSAFKPIVYSTALDNGFTPASVVLDAPFVFTDFEQNKTWKPENFENVFYGPTLLRNALIKSRNLVTIRVAEKIGVDKIVERAEAMGLKAEFPEELDLSVALGSAPVSLLSLCQAFTTFARGGSYVEPRLILKVESAWGEEMYASEVRSGEAMSPETAYIISSMLKDVVQHGTGWRARVLGKPVAGKTGTSNNEQDAWFIGFTPYLLTGVYVGFDQLTPMGKWETGSRAASPAFVKYRLAVEPDYPYQDFTQPPGVIMTKVDEESGLLAGPGTTKSCFLPFKTDTQPTETAPAAAQGAVVPAHQGGEEDLFKQID